MGRRRVLVGTGQRRSSRSARQSCCAAQLGGQDLYRSGTRHLDLPTTPSRRVHKDQRLPGKSGWCARRRELANTAALMDVNSFCRSYCLTGEWHPAAGCCLTKHYTLDPVEANARRNTNRASFRVLDVS